jgi:hypothetical protein
VNVSPSGLERPGWSLDVTWSSGTRNQLISAVTAAPKTISPPVTSPRLAASQRDRGTVWVQASRQVPRSSSPPSSGAPTTIPSSPGIARSGTLMSWLRPRLNWFTNDVMSAGQPVPPLRARQAGMPSLVNLVRIQVPTMSAKTASAQNTTRQAIAWARCWRQVTQIMT